MWIICTIVGTFVKEILELIKEVQHHFLVKQLAPLKHYFGINVQQNQSVGTIILFLAKYVDNILDKCDMATCFPTISTPFIV